MAQGNALENKLVVLVGGSGFVGSQIAQGLLESGARLRIASRHPEEARKLKPLANLGQMQLVHCDVKKPETLRACLNGADAVVYLVGTFGPDAKDLHAEGARIAADEAARQGAESFVYISSMAADAESEGRYASTKAQGEKLVAEAFPTATVLRPSVIFGEDDAFINMFAKLISFMPALPIFGPDKPVQPVWVNDVAQSVNAAMGNPAKHGGKTYELAGPETFTMEELHQAIAKEQGRSPAFIPVPDPLSAVFAALPLTPMSSEQWDMLKAGSVAAGKLPGLAQLGITAKTLSLFLGKWMLRYRKQGRFSVDTT